MRVGLLALTCIVPPGVTSAEVNTNRVFNGSFESSLRRFGVPDGWTSAGNAAVKQRLVRDSGRDGQSCARLECSEFTGDGPDFHAMVCQVGRINVRSGQWYRLTFWAKGQGIKGGAVELALNNTRPWENAGLADAFRTSERWERFEFPFRARLDLPAATSRLQFWFKSTGTLWLDEVELNESAEGQQWFPQIATEKVKNFVPNSSFECGTAGWGSYTWGLGGWAGNLYRLEGELDSTVAAHGQHALRISLNPQTLPVFWFDYYEPIRQPVRRVLVANRGWFRVSPGERLTLSAFLRADADPVTGQLVAVEPGDHSVRQAVSVGREWKRFEFSFVPLQPFLYIAVGLDLEASKREAATLWVDGIQLERGAQATGYEPRRTVEAFLETRVAGNIFTNLTQGAAFTVRAYNNADTAAEVQGQLAVTDFFDQNVFTNAVRLNLPAHAGDLVDVKQVSPNRGGFFQANWTTEEDSHSLRGAIIEPADSRITDSPVGFNHAYPWDFLVSLAHQAGIIWWRDWSAKWQTVEPEKGRFNWTVPDQQIGRVLGLNGQVEVLLPFSSTLWSTTARPEEVAKAAGGNSYLGARLPLAYAPAALSDFGRYAAEAVRRYRQARPNGVTHFQILNEPVYTDYALPGKFGYTLDDYVRLLEVAYRAIKVADAQAVVVGGISAPLEAGWTTDFVKKGGLRFVDVLDLHNYDPARPAESFEDAFRALEDLIRAQGGPKPVWITEWGCYADDDPPCIPQTVGDATMNRCRWPSERAATEHIVKFTAVSFAHGVRKIFFHAGTCGTINGPDAGGVIFEYGGAPRRMYAGVAALTRLLGVPEASERIVNRGVTKAYFFRTGGQTLAIAWRSGEGQEPLRPVSGVAVRDIMGNPVAADASALSETPIYLLGANAELVERALP
ncbi:MAG: hypothetical protein AB9869_33355 [Verrucomicrobiia bacterium]